MLENSPPGSGGHPVTPDLQAGELAVLRTPDVMNDRGKGLMTRAALSLGPAEDDTDGAYRQELALWTN